MIYIHYNRKSTESDDKQVLSIPAQLTWGQKFAKENNIKIGYTFTETKSAKKPGREDFNEMLRLLNEKKAQGILTWHLDRLARNPKDGGDICWMLQNGIIQHIQTFSHSYYPTDNVLLMAVEFGMANQYIRDLSQNVTRGMLTKAKSGWMPNKPAIGYINNPVKNADMPIIRDEERFYSVRKIFDLFLSGIYSVSQILEKVNSQWELRTIRRGREGGKAITRSKLYHILNNPFYTGMIRYKGELYSGRHIPMITTEEFQRVQSMLGMDGRARPHHKVFAYTGLLRCGECGAQITAEEKFKQLKSGKVHRLVYYHCTKRIAGVKCSQHGIREEELEEQIKKLLSQIYISPRKTKIILDTLRIMHKEEAQSQKARLIFVQRTYESVQNKLNNLLGIRLEGLITDEEYLAKKNQLITEKTQLEEKLRDSGDRTEDWLDKAEKAFNFASHAVNKFNNGTIEAKKIILNTFGSNLTLKDKNMNADIREPFVMMKNCLIGLEEEGARLEPSKIAVQSREEVPVLSPSPSWWSVLDNIRTFFQNFQELIFIPTFNPQGDARNV